MRITFPRIAFALLVSLLIYGWTRLPSQEERDRQYQFTAQVVSVQPTLLSGCMPNWWEPAPLLEVILDREVEVKENLGNQTTMTSKIYVLFADYNYLKMGGEKPYQRTVDFLQLLSNINDVPKTWTYQGWVDEGKGCEKRVFIQSLNWEQKYQ